MYRLLREIVPACCAKLFAILPRYSTAENRLYPVMLWARFCWVFALLILCMAVQYLFMYRLLREIVLIRRSAIEDHISFSGLAYLWADKDARTVALYSRTVLPFFFQGLYRRGT